MVAIEPDLIRERDSLTQETILLAARVALRIWALDPRTLAIDLWAVIEDESLSDPRCGYRLKQCVSIIAGPSEPCPTHSDEWRLAYAYTAVMRALHVLVAFRLSSQTTIHARSM